MLIVYFMYAMCTHSIQFVHVYHSDDDNDHFCMTGATLRAAGEMDHRYPPRGVKLGRAHTTPHVAPHTERVELTPSIAREGSRRVAHTTPVHTIML